MTEDEANEPPRRRLLRAGAVAAAGLAAAGAGAWWAQRDAAPPSSAQARTAAAAGTGAGPAGPLPQPLRTREGQLIANADLHGRALVLNFWAPWCPPCVKEMPELDRFARSPAGARTLVIGLAVDETANVDRFLAAHPVSFPVVVVGYDGLAWAGRLGNDAGALPFTAVYDPAQRLAHKKMGPTSERELSGWTAGA